MSLCEVLHVKILRKLLLRYKSFLKFLHAYVNKWVILWKLKMPEFMNSSFNQLLFAPKVTGFHGNLGLYFFSPNWLKAVFIHANICLPEKRRLLNRSFCLTKFADNEVNLKVHKSRSNQTIVYGLRPRDPRWLHCHYRRNYELWQWIIMNEWATNFFRFFDGYENLKDLQVSFGNKMKLYKIFSFYCW